MGIDASALHKAVVEILCPGLQFVLEESCELLEGIQRRAISDVL